MKKFNKFLIAVAILLYGVTAAEATNYTLRTLSAGTTVATGDLIGSRQGSDTFDKSITVDQLKTFMSASPTLVTPALGTPASGVATNLTGTAASLTAGTTTKAASMSISGQTGLLSFTGLTSTNRIKTLGDTADTILELGGSYTPTGTWTSMTLVTPALGTPASGVATNLTGTAASLTAGHVTTNANLTGPITSTGNAVATLTAHNVLLGEGTSAIAYAPPVSAGYVLTDNGTGNDPTFQAASGGGTTSLAGLTTNVLFDANGNINLGNVTAAHASAINNTYVGNTAGNLTGSTTATVYNAGVGFDALHAQTSGYDETAIGGKALLVATSDHDDVAVGYLALSAQTGGAQDTSIGSKSLDGVTSGSNNTAVGYSAGTTITTGTTDTYIGASANASGATVTNETCVGYNCAGQGTNTVNLGNSSTTKLYLAGTQVALGNLSDAISNANNTTIGINVGVPFHASAVNNVYVGPYVGGVSSSTTTTIGNSALGYEALGSMQGGSQNTAIGNVALGNTTVGVNNTAVGSNSLNQAYNDSEVTAVGYYSLRSESNAGATALNVALGYEAGYATTACTTCTNSIFIGGNAHGSAATTANEIVIGEAAAGIGANQTVIGNSSTTQTNIFGGIVNKGTTFTISGCSASTPVGGPTAGTYASGTSGSCAVVITMNGATGETAPNGWSCHGDDITTTTDHVYQTATTTTTATLAGTTVTGDTIVFSCTGY